MLSFSEFIDDLSLVDLPLQGGSFTWSNFRDRPSFSSPIRLSFVAKGWGPRPFKWFKHLADNPDYVKEITMSSKVWVSNKLGDVGMAIRKLESICVEIEEAISQGDHDPRLLTKLN
ncbi:hypothetical protein V6N13_081237 [Hibiscus sabdariffa]